MAESHGVDLFESETIVDTDVYLRVSEETLERYADEPHASYLRAPSVQLRSSGWDLNMSGKIEERRLSSPDAVDKKVRGGLHVDYSVLNVFRNLFRLSQSDTAVHLVEACNELLLDRYLDEGVCNGLMTAATQQPDRAVEEIDRVGQEDRVVGVFLPTTGPLSPLGDPSHDVIYAAMEDNDLTPVHHGATNSGSDVGFPTNNRPFEKFITAHINAHLWSQIMTVRSLIVNGVPEKFPVLDFAILDAGIGWFPCLANRLNKEAAMRRAEVSLHPPNRVAPGVHHPGVPEPL